MECYKLYSDYIMHSRTKGSKNGERRYQNEDGTYTELGKERRRVGGDLYNGPSKDQDTKTLEDMKTYVQAHATKKAYQKALAEENASDNSAVATLNQISNASNQLANASSVIGKKIDSKKNKKSVKKAAERAKNMSDDELRRITNRINLENNYIRAVTPETHKGENTAREILQAVGAIAGIAAVTTDIVLKIKHR